MPELANIQTYEKIAGTNYKPVLDRFSKVLKSIGVWNVEIEKTFESFVWDEEENGFVYSFNSIEPVAPMFSNIKVRPLVMGWTTSIDSSFTDNWISCDLLIEAENLRSLNSSGTDKYYPFVFELIRNFSCAFANEFHQTGIYFTDEGQDGVDFDGVRSNDKSKIWQFDYALIPWELKELYSDIPNTHFIIKHQHYFEAIYRERWEENSVNPKIL